MLCCNIQHNILRLLDKKNCIAVRVFCMDFSKAFDSVKHNILSGKLKTLSISPILVNWMHSFLRDRKQRVVFTGYEGPWKYVNKGTIQGSVSGPHLFNMFLNDLDVVQNSDFSITKYADDTTLISPVWKCSNIIIDSSYEMVKSFIDWTTDNHMVCNPVKCKEVIFRKGNKGMDVFQPIFDIPQCDSIKILGIKFESNCRFIEHVREIMRKVNQSLYVIRSLRKEGYSQKEVDYLFQAIVLSKIRYGLSVYGASLPELTTIQSFLDRCVKRHYYSKEINIHTLLEQSDKQIVNTIVETKEHPLQKYLPKAKLASSRLRKKSCLRPVVNTERFKNSFVNRLVYNYELAF